MTKSNKIKLNDCYLQIEKQRASYLKTCTLCERKHILLETRRLKSNAQSNLKRPDLAESEILQMKNINGTICQY